MTDRDFDQHASAKLEGFAPAPPEGLWKRVEAELPPASHNVGGTGWLAGLGVLFLAVMAVYLLAGYTEPQLEALPLLAQDPAAPVAYEESAPDATGLTGDLAASVEKSASILTAASPNKPIPASEKSSPNKTPVYSSRETSPRDPNRYSSTQQTQLATTTPKPSNTTEKDKVAVSSTAYTSTLKKDDKNFVTEEKSLTDESTSRSLDITKHVFAGREEPFSESLNSSKAVLVALPAKDYRLAAAQVEGLTTTIAAAAVMSPVAPWELFARGAFGFTPVPTNYVSYTYFEPDAAVGTLQFARTRFRTQPSLTYSLGAQLRHKNGFTANMSLDYYDLSIHRDSYSHNAVAPTGPAIRSIGSLKANLSQPANETSYFLTGAIGYQFNTPSRWTFGAFANYSYRFRTKRTLSNATYLGTSSAIALDLVEDWLGSAFMFDNNPSVSRSSQTSKRDYASSRAGSFGGSLTVDYQLGKRWNAGLDFGYRRGLYRATTTLGYRLR